VFLFKIGIENGIKMFSRDDPYIVSIEEKLDSEQIGEALVSNMTKMLL